MTSPRPSIAIVGGGPRGVLLLDRLAANAERLGPDGIDVHIVDDTQIGAGRIWRTDQTRELCMNTLAHAVTLFTDDSVAMAGPVHEGPTMYEWCQLALAEDVPGAAPRDAGPDPDDEGRSVLIDRDDVPQNSDDPQAEARADSDPDASHAFTAELRARIASIPAEHVRVFRTHAVREGLVDDYRSELETQRPESHPTRSLYGEYIRWCWERAVAAVPGGIRVHEHIGRVVEITNIGDRDVLHLAPGGAAEERGLGATEVSEDGGRTEPHAAATDAQHSDARLDAVTITADATVVAAGWLQRAETDAERHLAEQASAAGLVWVREGSPVDQRLDNVPDGADAIVRGLGMGFFDAMALLTVDRGGRFVSDDSAAGGLRYEPSGREPRLFVSSHRGVPYRAKTLYGSLPPKAPQRYARSVDWAARPRPIDFDRELWPLVVRDAFCDYYETLDRVSPGAVRLADALAAIDATEADPDDLPAALAAAVAPAVDDPADRLDLDALMFPGRGIRFASVDEYDAWVAEFVAHDLAESARGRDSAEKAALWSISSARGVAHRVGTFGGFDLESRRRGYRRLLSIGGQAGSGPPWFRNQQLLALHAAGLVRFIGPAARVTVEGGAFRAETSVHGSAVAAPVLIDALVHAHDAGDSADPLVRSLSAAGRLRPFEVRRRAGGWAPTAGIDIDPATNRAIGTHGEPDATLHIAGLPLDETMHDAAISPMPGANSTMLREIDRTARSLLHAAGVPVRGPRTQA
ncbi:FAD/NAD(P)-binding protein [Microbacterium halophytorum]|uniref:FAD/NAD(P)-binding protein n=1 Tax=Microbacterium halophytorum TaxID=2067568 RepID=UPI000CFAB421|nr:FAD/NAD(P)-binding protein [Microbacterium halophytorum]